MGTEPDEITLYVDKPYDPQALVKLVRELVAYPVPAGAAVRRSR
ncbi:MAG: hypothetical protein ACR2J1_07145 [Methyloceanibacter sp.]